MEKVASGLYASVPEPTFLDALTSLEGVCHRLG